MGFLHFEGKFWISFIFDLRKRFVKGSFWFPVERRDFNTRMGCPSARPSHFRGLRKGERAGSNLYSTRGGIGPLPRGVRQYGPTRKAQEDCGIRELRRADIPVRTGGSSAELASKLRREPTLRRGGHSMLGVLLRRDIQSSLSSHRGRSSGAVELFRSG